MRRILVVVGLSFLSQAVHAQEWQGNPNPLAVGPQFQGVPSTNQFPPSPPAIPVPADQFALPPVQQFQAPPPNAPPLPGQFQVPPLIHQQPVPLPVDTGPLPLPVTKVEPPPKIWEGGLELGLNGSDGNSQTFNLHVGAKVKRKTECNILSSELDYKQNSSDSVETANKAFLDSRFEHLFKESPWTWFVHNIVDYDRFKAYDLRVSLDTGLGYQLIKNDTTSLISRFGGGTTREIGGPDDKYIPELVFGLEGEHKINKRQKLCASVEYRPDVTDFANYRLNSKAAWEVLLDEEMHLSMKVGVLDRYDSYSNGKEPNDLDYTLTLLWSF